ncbi:MAG: PadR family transcriptional regulator [Lachnospiraceae bacterium]|nr:PadR family transcriptional regulator [Lachnospiraceae bacterium]
MMKNTPLTEALFYILLSLRKPNHGYGIILEVEELTKGRVVLGPGTLYGAIQTMMEKGWIRIYSEETVSRKKKQYIITDLGTSVFLEEKMRLEELLANSVLFEEDNQNDSI